MKENRDIALAYILKWEDMSLNLSPNEPGGASKGGVSVDYLTDYYRAIGLARKAEIADVTVLTEADVRKVYGVMLLDALRFDELPSGVDYALADVEVNSGSTGGVWVLQLALGMWPLTGILDAATMAAVQTEDPKSLVKAIRAAWISKKHESPNWGPNPPITKNGFGHGWSNRNIDARALALGMCK